MIKSIFVKSALKIALAAALITSVSVVAAPQTTQAARMDCYHWFDFYYKATGDLDFAYYGYQVCQQQR